MQHLGLFLFRLLLTKAKSLENRAIQLSVLFQFVNYRDAHNRRVNFHNRLLSLLSPFFEHCDLASSRQGSAVETTKGVHLQMIQSSKKLKKKLDDKHLTDPQCHEQPRSMCNLPAANVASDQQTDLPQQDAPLF